MDNQDPQVIQVLMDTQKEVEDLLELQGTQESGGLQAQREQKEIEESLEGQVAMVHQVQLVTKELRESQTTMDMDCLDQKDKRVNQDQPILMRGRVRKVKLALLELWVYQDAVEQKETQGLLDKMVHQAIKGLKVQMGFQEEKDS